MQPSLPASILMEGRAAGIGWQEERERNHKRPVCHTELREPVPQPALLAGFRLVAFPVTEGSEQEVTGSDSTSCWFCFSQRALRQPHTDSSLGLPEPGVRELGREQCLCPEPRGHPKGQDSRSWEGFPLQIPPGEPRGKRTEGRAQ